MVKKKYDSPFGFECLKKFGWSEGDLIGTENSGLAEPLIINSHKATFGLGGEDLYKEKTKNWWEESYNDSIILLKKTVGRGDESDSTCSNNSELDHSIWKMNGNELLNLMKIKKDY